MHTNGPSEREIEQFMDYAKRLADKGGEPFGEYNYNLLAWLFKGGHHPMTFAPDGLDYMPATPTYRSTPGVPDKVVRTLSELTSSQQKSGALPASQLYDSRRTAQPHDDRRGHDGW